MDLKTFFQSLPQPALAQYQRLYVDTKSDKRPAVVPALVKMDEAQVNTAADALTALFSDRLWVREQLKAMPKTHHVALIALLQNRGVGGGTWLLQELTQSHGMSEDLWAEVLHALGCSLWVFGNSHQSPPLFYIIPNALADVLSPQFRKRLGLQGASPDEEVQLSRSANYRHPLGFSIVSFLTYIRQNKMRITRKDEIFKKSQEELCAFFTHLWGDGVQEKVLDWHLDLVQELGLMRQRGGYLSVDDRAIGEYLALSPQQRRDLYMAYFIRQERLLIWLLETLSQLDPESWVPLKRLRTLYRRRYMGDVFHRRYIRKSYYLPPSGYYDPNPPLEVLAVAGLVEHGVGRTTSYVRLSEVGRAFVAGEGSDAFESSEGVQFFVQPTFDVLAPVGIPLDDLWKLGEIAELKRVDRASTYNLNRDSIRGALDDGWRCEDLVGFLSERSSVQLPQNVVSNIEDWVGRHGEIEFHDTLVLRASKKRSAATKKVLESLEVPYEVLGEGLFAIPREQKEQILEGLREKRLAPAPKVRVHDLSDDPALRRGHLHALLDDPTLGEDEEEAISFPTKSLIMLGAPTADGGLEAMAQRGFRSGKLGVNAVGADLSLKPAAAGAGDLLKLSPGKTMSVVKAAIRLKLDLEVLYPSTGDNDPGGLSRVTPDQVQDAGGSSFFSGHHHRLDKQIDFQIRRIQGIRLAT